MASDLTFLENPKSTQSWQCDIQEDTKRWRMQLVGSQELDAVVSTIEVYNMETIVNFGYSAAEKIAASSDHILRSMSTSQLSESDELFDDLSKIMSKLDIGELNENTGLFGKWFGRKQLDKIIDKYQAMASEVDRVYIKLKSYESEIKRANDELDRLFESNVEYYHELVKYVMAGEEGIREIEEYIVKREADFEKTGDESIQFELVTLRQALNSLEKRTQDLHMTESVALQTIPMIKFMEDANINLIRKINSTFIVTLPVFKQSLAQAIMLKRRKLQMESLAALEKKTGDMLKKNTGALEDKASHPYIGQENTFKIETLKEAYQTIIKAIDETRTIQKNAKNNRINEKKRFDNYKQEL